MQRVPLRSSTVHIRLLRPGKANEGLGGAGHVAATICVLAVGALGRLLPKYASVGILIF